MLAVAAGGVMCDGKLKGGISSPRTVDLNPPQAYPHAVSRGDRQESSRCREDLDPVDKGTTPDDVTEQLL